MANRNKPANYKCHINQTFGDWTVIDDSHRVFRKVYFTCRCVCGVIRNVASQSVKRGTSVSCGCSRGASYTLDGHTSNKKAVPGYFSWQSMKARCSNKNHPAYKYYGGKGIVVCDAWKNSFNAFIKDMGPPPEGQQTIDRIDNSLGYFKNNCKWASQSEQCQNRSWSHPAIPRNRDEKGRYA